MTVRKASLNSSPFLLRQVIKRGQTNAYYYFFRKLKYGYGAKIGERICRQAKQKTQAILCVLTSIFAKHDGKSADKICADNRIGVSLRPKFSKHWICIRKSVKTERFYHHTPTQKSKKGESYVKKKKRN